MLQCNAVVVCVLTVDLQEIEWVFKLYTGADKSLARPGRKQATATEDLDFHISYL